jgi:hypothetical protein
VTVPALPLSPAGRRRLTDAVDELTAQIAADSAPIGSR